MLQDIDESVEEKTVVDENSEVNFLGKKLLLVEDNSLNREIARKLLNQKGFVVDEAIDGKEALEKITASKVGDYVAVLMDIQMPVMDGYEATKQIRAMDNRRLANLPIIAMTANAFGEERQKAFACGMNGYVTKPIEMNVLFDTLKQIIE